MVFMLIALSISCIPLSSGISVCPTREITASAGRITSPGYPNNYQPSIDCVLTFRQPLDTKFTFTFNKLDLEGNSDDELSCYDTLTISEVDSKDYCGKTTPQPRTTKLNIVKLRFQTDSSNQQTGFDLYFSTATTSGLPTPINVCPTRETDARASGGRINSPNFPEDYGNNLDCKLTMRVPPYKKMEITYDLFAVEYSGGCVKDKVAISSSGGKSKTSCGTGQPTAAVFKGNKVYVHFTTDSRNSDRGFMLSYKLLDDQENTPSPSVLTTQTATGIQLNQSCACPDGNQYIKRTLAANNIVKRQDDDFSVEFKTAVANGLIIYAKGSFRDYILLKLQNGNIVFEVDLGTGSATVPVSSGSLNDNTWHKAVVMRRGKSVTVTVDDLSEVVGSTPGNYSKLDIKGSNAALYVLGGPSTVPFSHNFKGCVRNLEVDGLQPIEAAKQNVPTYTLYGLSVLSSCS